MQCAAQLMKANEEANEKRQMNKRQRKANEANEDTHP